MLFSGWLPVSTKLLVNSHMLSRVIAINSWRSPTGKAYKTGEYKLWNLLTCWIKINHITVNCSNLSEEKINLNLKFWNLTVLMLTKMKNGMKVSNFKLLNNKITRADGVITNTEHNQYHLCKVPTSIRVAIIQNLWKQAQDRWCLIRPRNFTCPCIW